MKSTMQELKQQQIQSLRKICDNVDIDTEGSTFNIPCGEDDCTLLVNLPVEFPEEAPIITVSPKGLRHPWINNGIVMHEALNQWSNQSSLGAIVKMILDEFAQRRPARKLANGDTKEGYHNRPPPPIPTGVSPEYSAILKMSPEEVEELLANDTAFEIYFNTLNQVQHTKSAKKSLIDENENLAQKNLARSEELQKLQFEANDLDAAFQTLKHDFEEKGQQQDVAFGRFDGSTVLTRLKASEIDSDKLSESIRTSFLDGELDHDVFVKQFREIRKLYHLRASKLERAEKDKLFS